MFDIKNAKGAPIAVAVIVAIAVLLLVSISIGFQGNVHF